MKYILCLILLLSSCSESKDGYIYSGIENSKFKIKEELLGRGYYRMENSEVICYSVYDHAVQCKWKDK